MNDTKMILLIGRSGKGKSTLANVVTGTNKFKESEKSASETRKIQFEQFKDKKNGFNYQIIDTPGIGDTKLKENEVLDIIAEAVYLVREGVSQVFFVINGRFDKYEMATYDLLRTIIFDQNITKHTTIVRTRFEKFKKKEEYQADIDLMVKEAKETRTKLEQDIVTKEKELANLSPDNVKYQELFAELEKAKKELVTTNLAEILESCQERIIYVDNPSLKITAPDGDEEDEEEREEREAEVKSNERKRSESRKIVLNHLQNICQGQEDYNPLNLKKLSAEIADDYFDYLKKKEELQKELDSLKTEATDKTSKVESGKNEFKNTSAFESSKVDLVVKKEESQTEEENNVGIVKTQEVIAQLQDKKAKLLKEIEEREKVIRQKVLKHIFNNYEGISKELGGDIFLSSVAGDHNWQDIHPNFTNKEMVSWLSQGFDYEQAQKWATALGDDFKPEIDADFCVWLRDAKKLSVDKVKRRSHPCSSVEQLRQEYLQQLQGEVSILDKHNEQLGQEEKSTAQKWLDKNYPKEKRSQIIKLNIGNKKLTGVLDLSDFVNLEWLDCSHNQLTSLNLTNLNKLTRFDCNKSRLTDLQLTGCSELKRLHAYENEFKKVDLSVLNSKKVTHIYFNDNPLMEISESGNLDIFKDFINLEALGVNGVKLSGSLKPLEKCSKLWLLGIDNTDIDSGLEYLPESVKKFTCSANNRKDAKCKTIADLLENLEGKDFSQKLQAYKQKLQEQSQQQAQILQPATPSFDPNK